MLHSSTQLALGALDYDLACDCRWLRGPDAYDCFMIVVADRQKTAGTLLTKICIAGFCDLLK